VVKTTNSTDMNGLEMKELIKQHFKGNYKVFFERYLKNVKKSIGDEFGASCCFHDDHHPSFSFNAVKGVFKCHACGVKGDFYKFYGRKHNLRSFREICQGIATDFGIPLNGAEPKPVSKSRKPFLHYDLGEPLEKYPYTDQSGTPLYYNCRFPMPDGGKTFRQCKPDGANWSVKGIEPVPQPVLSLSGKKAKHHLLGLP
jgi:CHC2 zinc finger